MLVVEGRAVASTNGRVYRTGSAAGAFFGPGSAEAFDSGILFAHVGAVLGRSVSFVTGEMVHFGAEIGPDDGVAGTMRFGLRF